jgi:ElaB/YqjD/DUF883 family membrane-anchored ribosome-binding protein
MKTNSKCGAYIEKLMTTILDKEQEDFIRDLAYNELKKISNDINSFLAKNAKDDVEELEKRQKQLLQEDKNVKDK